MDEIWKAVPFFQKDMKQFLDLRSSSGNFVLDEICAMSWLGRVEAEYRGEISSYEGLGRGFAVDGKLNLEAITEQLKRICDSLKPPMLEWQDNHTALILNLMRFAHLLRVYERQRGPKSRCELKIYDDGVFCINPADAFKDWGPEYSNEWKIHWPGGIEDANYPDIAQITEMDYMIDREVEVIDLRRCSKDEALIILMMTAAWKRTSLYKSDFSLPKLADKIRYRANGVCPFLTDLNRAPKVPKSSDVWRAMVVYVESNRLFTSFSLALYLFANTASAMVPDSVEGQIWHVITTRLVVPRFHSIRGRCSVFNEGLPSMVNRRAAREWYFFAKVDKKNDLDQDLRKLQMLAVAVAQAIYTGIGVRATLRGIGTHEDELNATKEPFLKEETCFPAAIAGVLNMPVLIPSGMEGVYAYFEGFTDDKLAMPMTMKVRRSRKT